MNAQTLPLPNPGDWLTINGAAMVLRVSRRTIERMIIDGRLNGYRIEGASKRLPSQLLWRPQVLDLADAIRKTRTTATSA